LPKGVGFQYNPKTVARRWRFQHGWLLYRKVICLLAYCPYSPFQISATLAPLRCPLTSLPLEYADLPPFARARINPDAPGLWRYQAMLPVVKKGKPRISLGEGWTPLVPDQWAGRDVFWKLDALMPTGSYKDRGVSVMVNWLAGLGAQTVVDDSSGNAGASLACYAARAGLTARIFVPESAPAPKRAQIAVYGAELVEVQGPRSVARLAAETDTQQVRGVAYASHAWHPAFLLGQMTCAWEIWEQMGRRVPDWLVAPVGNGGLLLGTWRGFQHLQKSGLTDHLPRLLAVQVEPYTAIYEAFHNGNTKIEADPRVEQISADGIAISQPVHAQSVLQAVRESGGTVMAVEDRVVLAFQDRLATRGLFVEPTSATVAAAIARSPLTFGANDRIVAILTGHGLKHPPKLT
jgi:threonine synthase